jgi:glutathione synthase/RimK-type ligase-like ATP-grasp enzyme
MNKIAIHKSSWGFSPEWINYCEKNNIPHKIVDCYNSDIIEQLEDCQVLFWHHHHSDAKDVLFAKGLLFALEQAGKKVYPNFNTGWHFDDKVGQKYLLEAINAPMAKAWVFYEKQDALKWLETTTYPKVFKLRGGAGSTNVKLMRSKKQAQKMVKKAFGKGFPAYAKWNDLKEQYLRFQQGKLKWIEAVKSLRRAVVSTRFARTVGNQKGYIYFQEFIPNNDSDTRIIVDSNKAYGLRRMVRKGDFRASGSGVFDYNGVSLDAVKVAIEVADKLNLQSVAFDFIFNEYKKPIIVEISYAFGTKGVSKCPGYWDKDLNWHEGKFNQVEWIFQEYLRK